MGKLSDLQIRVWVKRGEHFEQRGDGDGLYLRFREVNAVLRWIFRYRFDGVGPRNPDRRRGTGCRVLHRAGASLAR